MATDRAPSAIDTQKKGRRAALRQTGMATILTVVLIGIAITALALTLTHSTRATQEKQIAAHSQTHAQTSLWLGIDTFRRFLGQLDADAINALNNSAELAIEIDPYYGSISAQDIQVNSAGSFIRVSATVTATHPEAKASAGMQVVFNIDPTACTDCVQLSAALSFQDDLLGTNDVNFDQPVTINVEGDIDFSNIDVTTLGALNATGSITLNNLNNITVDSIHANGDVEVDQVSVARIDTQGSVTIDEDAAVSEVYADGDITHEGTSNTTRMRSRQNITIGGTSGNHSNLNAAGIIEVQGGPPSYSATINQLSAVGDVTVTSADAVINTIESEAGLGCPTGTWSGYTNVAINGLLGASCVDIASDLAAQDPLASDNPITIPAGVTVNVMPPVPAYALPQQQVDVWDLKDDANYVLSHNGTNATVTVYNINGSVSGTEYLLGKSSSNSTSLPDALCEALDASGKCTCATPGCTLVDKHICIGYSSNEGCISYSGGTWTLAGVGIAPGIWFIDGNVEVSNGFNNATMLVSGNIHSSNHYRGAAVNYGGEPPNYDIADRTAAVIAARTTPYDEICQLEATGLKEAASHMVTPYHDRFITRYPTNLCGPSNTEYFPIPTGNIALAAGGIRPVSEGGDGTTYEGGDISVGANTQVYGITMAGGYFESRDNAAFFGYIMSAALGTKRADGSTKNLLSGNTRVILDTETDYYNPSEVPQMGSQPPCLSGCGNAGDGGPTLLWSKFL